MLGSSRELSPTTCAALGGASTDRTGVSYLIAQVEAATEGLSDSDLVRVLAAVRGTTVRRFDIGTGDDGSDEIYVRFVGGESYSDYRSRCPDVCLAAALELVERFGPPHGPIGLTIAGSAQATLEDRDPCGWSVQAIGRTPALAILGALLKAIQAQAGEGARPPVQSGADASPGMP